MVAVFDQYANDLEVLVSPDGTTAQQGAFGSPSFAADDQSITYAFIGDGDVPTLRSARLDNYELSDAEDIISELNPFYSTLPLSIPVLNTNPKPVLSATQTSLDFGNVLRGEIVERELCTKNEGRFSIETGRILDNGINILWTGSNSHLEGGEQVCGSLRLDSTDLTLGTQDIDLALDHDGVNSPLPISVSIVVDIDTDGDGIANEQDTDDDNDGLSDIDESLLGTDPLDTDTDDDGVGDNSDDFPTDPTETMDTDSDGIGDNADAFPEDDSEWTDTDSDGIGNNADTDDDNDGVDDGSDALPLDPDETSDSDGDGIGDNAELFEKTQVTDVFFRGELRAVSTDIGGSYTGVALGRTFVGSINPSTGFGFISDGNTRTDVECCVEAAGTVINNDASLTQSGAELFNTVMDTAFSASDVVDVIKFSADTSTDNGGRIEVGLWSVLESSALDDVDQKNHPPRPGDLLGNLFYVIEVNAEGTTLYEGYG